MLLLQDGFGLSGIKKNLVLGFFSFQLFHKNGGIVAGRVGSGLSDPGFDSFFLQTFFGRTYPSKICLVPEHSEKKLDRVKITAAIRSRYNIFYIYL